MFKRSGLWLTIVVLAAIAAGLFVVPQVWGEKWRPWKLGLDLVGGSHLVYQVDLSEVDGQSEESVLNGLRDVIERRINQFGVSEPRVFVAESEGDTRLVVELAGVKDVSRAIEEIGETPFLEFQELQQVGTTTVPIATELTGRYVTGATLGFHQTTQEPQVAISFNDEGAELFGEITARNIGNPVAILLDGEVISAPVVQQQITGGRAQITGDFTLEEARTLVQRFNAGALPAPIELINQQTISATLGQDSLDTGIFAGIIGTVLVALFMIVYYRKLGVFSAVALLFYVVFTLAIFKLIPITMTLAGVAGFILTIGMAVDANILIFERMKEEFERGNSTQGAIAEGFRHAWPAIRDSNISTLITAVILYFFTSSFVRGFAVTLFIGTLTSMFSAITTTQLLLQVFLPKLTTKKKPA